METIQWNEHFLTGLDKVDRQHHKLVNLTNHLVIGVVENRFEYPNMKKLLTELLDYTEYHFETEEGIMGDSNVDLDYQEIHRKEHISFLNHVSVMSKSITPGGQDSAKGLLAFLTRWLVYHILGSDKILSKQIDAITRGGVSPKEAYHQQEQGEKGATEILLVSLNGLFKQLSAQNIELTELNQNLEAKVLERTRALSQVNRKLEEMAMTDALTGLPNRRHAMALLKVFWEEYLSQNTKLSCLMLDADGFKQINDQYGHDAGDVVLKELSAELRNVIRTDDFVARLGGDEFFILCPNTDHFGALTVANSICEKIALMMVPAGRGNWYGSVSIGVATTTVDMPDIEALIKAADQGVYAAKAAGKGCVKTVQ